MEIYLGICIALAGFFISAGLYYGAKEIKITSQVNLRITSGGGPTIEVEHANIVQPTGLVLEGDGASVMNSVFNSAPVNVAKQI